jgi:hypothetical protein
VRPPDENQHGSTRPNFMSASRRHNSGEDNILARLERDGKRGAAGKSWQHKNTTLAWCGLASLAVAGLVAVLASLAKENVTVHRTPLVVEARVPSDRYADPDGRSGFAPLPALPSPPRKSVVMVEEPLVRAVPRPAPAPAVAPEVAPMVMLKPAAAAAARPVKPAAAPVKLAAVPAAVRSPAARPAAKSPPARTAPVKVAAAPAPRVLAATPARPKKVVPPGAAAKPEPAAVDSDVALLSAIILHASRHAAERAQLESAACPSGKKCPAPKATD